MNRVAFLIGAVVATLAPLAHADFASPPEHRAWRSGPPDERADEPYAPAGTGVNDSSLRLFTGPAVRFAQDATSGGLVAAIDVGEHAAGARLSGNWMRAGSDGGVSQYTGELWVDFGDGHVVRPVLAAGGGIARLDRANDANGDVATSTIGVGVLRAALQYGLPVRAVDARASLDIVGSIPAFGSDAGRESPWLTAALTIGVGF